MDSTALLAQIREYWSKVPQKQLIFVLLILFTISIAFSVSQLTWLLMPQGKQSQSVKVTKQALTQASTGQIDVSKIVSLNLFGKAEAKKVEQPKEDVAKVFKAPETKLNLKLSSAVASSDDSLAAAVIENNKTQQTYGIGDKIAGTNATLNNVLIDRVIISVSGRNETLMLDGFKYTEVSESQIVSNNNNSDAKRRDVAAPVQKQNIQSKEFSQKISDLKQVINRDPSKITDYIRIMPARDGNRIKGYRLSPANDPAFFKEAGLKAGDLAIEINGRDLTDPRQAMEALQLLRTESEISLTVDRAGQLTEINFSTL